MTTAQLQAICDDLYRDRAALREFNPALSESDAVFWILYGSLASLLDAPPDYEPEIVDTEDIYHAGVCALLERFAPEGVAWQGVIAELAEGLRR